jgi:mRNA interferase MazF
VVTPDRYVPERGDVVWMDLSPRVGHEQSGYRPSLIVSPQKYNRRVELALICPITSQVKGFPFEVAIPEGNRVTGVVLADQMTSIDWRARRVRQMDHLPIEFVEEVMKQFVKLLPLPT